MEVLLMKRPILITGTAGLVGTSLANRLLDLGIQVVFCDLRATGDAFGDVCDVEYLRKAARDVDGIVHLAAVTRVVVAEHDPELCVKTNVGGVRNVIDAALSQTHKPWLLFASSREVYGEPRVFPVEEDATLSPMNVYGRSKVEGERLVEHARAIGIRTSIVRLSNVYGSTHDHPDRVVPAFARAAVMGGVLRIDGPNHTFDFTHIDDVVEGLLVIIRQLSNGESRLPPIHLVSGIPTSLSQLAELAIRLGSSNATMEISDPRAFDVHRFVGSPTRASTILGWKSGIDVETGVAKLLEDFRVQIPSKSS